MGMWRCMLAECQPSGQEHPGLDFESDEPTCPKCGTSARTPEGRRVIVKREAIHLLVKDKQGPIVGDGYRFRALCDPTLRLGPESFRATGDPQVATCPACLRHPEFPAAEAPMLPAWKMGERIKERG